MAFAMAVPSILEAPMAAVVVDCRAKGDWSSDGGAEDESEGGGTRGRGSGSDEAARGDELK